MEYKDLLALYNDLESDRVERKEAWTKSSKGKILEAICAFANDLPNQGLAGVIFVGVKDDGTCADITIDDELLLSIAQCKDNGNIVPFPNMVVQKHNLNGCEVVAIIVKPSYSPPVSYQGRIWVRVGPRRALASRDEERILSEKRRAKDLPFDLKPIYAASLNDLDMVLFERVYLPAAIAPGILAENERSLEHQLVSLRFLDTMDLQIPTLVGMLTLGKNPRHYIYGAYVQFLRIAGTEVTDTIVAQRQLSHPLPDMLRMLDDLLEINITTNSDFIGKMREQKQSDYPLEALRQLVRNAILHRNYEATNSPVRIYWFTDRIEISNPGGLYGQVNKGNLGKGVTDYRNPHIAEVLNHLDFVQRFGFGIPIAEKALADNGNPPIDFQISAHNVLAVIRPAKQLAERKIS